MARDKKSRASRQCGGAPAARAARCGPAPAGPQAAGAPTCMLVPGLQHLGREIVKRIVHQLADSMVIHSIGRIQPDPGIELNHDLRIKI